MGCSSGFAAHGIFVIGSDFPSAYFLLSIEVYHSTIFWFSILRKIAPRRGARPRLRMRSRRDCGPFGHPRSVFSLISSAIFLWLFSPSFRQTPIIQTSGCGRNFRSRLFFYLRLSSTLRVAITATPVPATFSRTTSPTATGALTCA